MKTRAREGEQNSDSSGQGTYLTDKQTHRHLWGLRSLSSPGKTVSKKRLVNLKTHQWNVSKEK